VSQPTGSSVFVDRFYEMDPEFEDLLSGRDLKDGMVVLIEDYMLRGDPEHLGSDNRYEQARIRETNRWCTVTNVRLTYGQYPCVTFFAVYADGTKRKRMYAQEYAWIVKLDSIPEESR